MEAKQSNNTVGGGGVLNAALLDGPVTKWLAAVIELLDRQRSLCGRLEYLSREQSMHVREGRNEALVGVLADRQRVIDEVVDLNARLEPFRTRRERLMQALGPVDRRSVEMKVEEIAASVERVRLQDDADRVVLEGRRKGVADELTGLVRGRGAVAAYGNAAPRVGETWKSGHERHG